jgi:hypothetical protein
MLQSAWDKFIETVTPDQPTMDALMNMPCDIPAEAALVGLGMMVGGIVDAGRILQYGGNTLKQSTLDALELTKEEGKAALEALKSFNGIQNFEHNVITAAGDVFTRAGTYIDNIYNHVH